MKKSHIITYITALLLMLSSYLFYATSFKTGELTLYEHSFHLFGIVLMFIPFLFEIIFKKDLPLILSIGFYIFIFMSQILGSAYDMYSRFMPLDLIAHGFSAFLIALFFAYISKSIMQKEHMAYQFLYLVACSIFVGVIWEIVEFCGDSWFGMNCQGYRLGETLLVGQDALKDTMQDLIIDLIGACLGAGTMVVINYYSKKAVEKANEKNI